MMWRMRIKMTKTKGSFVKGRVYDVSNELGEALVAAKIAKETTEAITVDIVTKPMQPEQVKKGGL